MKVLHLHTKFKIKKYKQTDTNAIIIETYKAKRNVEINGKIRIDI